MAVTAVVDEGSFEGAAQALAVTPSAISQRVRGYEERLGALLIVRGSPCRATELGQALCAHLDRVRLLEAEIPQLAGEVAQAGPRALSLKIAVNADSLGTWFPHAIAGFVKETGTLLDLRIEDEARTADRLRSGDVMAAVSAESDPVPGCRTTPLGRLRYVACASPDFVARHFAEGCTRAELERAPCICFEKRDAMQARWLRETHNMPAPAQTHYIPSVQGFLDFTLEGIGWALQPLSLARDHLARGRLVELPPRHSIDVGLHWVVPRLKSDLLARLTGHLMAQCAISPHLEPA